MKFSILLPTRNRLTFLQQAVYTVLRQDFEDWELVISDNASSEDVEGYVHGLSDRRIAYSRSATALSVTQNWNRALDASRGDYVLMLGDDDGLLPGALRKMASLTEQSGNPDLLFANALLFAYPDVMPDRPDGFLRRQRSPLFAEMHEPYRLSRSRALALVRQAMRFEMPFPFNAQYYLPSRRLVERVKAKGSFYQSPYPDYYGALAVMIASESTIVCPEPFMVIGITPKSFGYYYYNKRESEGTVFLDNANDMGADVAQAVAALALPGSKGNTSWLAALETVRARFSTEVELTVDYGAYRGKQLAELVFGDLNGRRWRRDVTALRRVLAEMSVPELVRFGSEIVLKEWPKRSIPRRLKPGLRRLMRRPVLWDWTRTGYSTMCEVYNKAEEQLPKGRGSSQS